MAEICEQIEEMGQKAQYRLSYLYINYYPYYYWDITIIPIKKIMLTIAIYHSIIFLLQKNECL